MRKLILLMTLAAFSWCVTLPVVETETAPAFAIAKGKKAKKHNKKKKHRKHRRHRRAL